MGEWTPINDLSHYPLVEDLPVVLPRVLACKPGDHPISGKYDYDEKERLRVTLS